MLAPLLPLATLVHAIARATRARRHVATQPGSGPALAPSPTLARPAGGPAADVDRWVDAGLPDAAQGTAILAHHDAHEDDR